MAIEEMNLETHPEVHDSKFTRFRVKFEKLLLPAVILQSVVIGGAYSTGREVVEYGAKYGAMGWVTVIVIFLGFTLTSILSFELARVFGVYDYKNWIKQLIWKFWPLFDLLFLAMAVVAIAVVASAAGNILKVTAGVPYFTAVVGVIVVVAVMIFYGADFIEKFKTVGSALLYFGYVIFACLVLFQRWDQVVEVFAVTNTAYVQDASLAAVVGTGVLYVGYNLAVFPTVLFVLYRQTTRRATVLSGILAGLFMTVPFFLTYLSLMAFYPADWVMSAPVPWLPVLQTVGGPSVILLFGIVVGWTLVESSVGVIHAIVDRIDRNISEFSIGPLTGIEGLSRRQRVLIGLGILLVATGLSRFGIIALVARGYSMMGYGFILLLAVPLLTIGVYRIAKPDWKSEFWNRG